MSRPRFPRRFRDDVVEGGVGPITREQRKQIPLTKMPDPNVGSVGADMKVVEGATRSMGVRVSG